jgi:hypothetical protein
MQPVDDFCAVLRERKVPRFALSRFAPVHGTRDDRAGETRFVSVFQFFSEIYSSTVFFQTPWALRMYSTASRAAPSPPACEVVQ